MNETDFKGKGNALADRNLSLNPASMIKYVDKNE